ncbi:MAG: DUF4012 domain-containing protein [Actinomycetia bacterium]|nr:DUF4012 domain-containing protein [Actinomycetes bacterium]
MSSRLKLLAWIALGMGLYGGAVYTSVTAARSEAESGRAQLDGLGEILGEGDLDLNLVDQLDQAEQHLGEARRLLGQPHLSPIGLLPIIGRQKKAAERMAITGDELVGGVLPVARRLEELRDGPPSDPQERVEQIGALHGEFTGLLAQIDGADLGPRTNLLPSLASARREFELELADTRALVADAKDLLGAAEALLEGPTTYAVLGLNTAEMRAGSGTVLQIGELNATQGKMTLADIRSTGRNLPEPGAEIPDQDLVDRWGFISPADDWRSVNYSPRFDEATGPLVESMWLHSFDTEIDGVIGLDPLALQALLAVVGPIQVDGLEIDQHNVIEQLFLEQYRGVFEEEGKNRARSQRLGEVASAAFVALEGRSWSLTSFIEAFKPVVQGRHLLLWSPHPLQQRGWEVVGATGSLTSDSLMVSLINWSGSKLDPFLDVDVELEAGSNPTDESVTELVLRVKIQNVVPFLSDEYRYVLGPYPSLDLDRGEQGSRLYINLPGHTDPSSVAIDGDPVYEVFGADGQTLAIGTYLSIAPGRSEEFVIRFSLPSDLDTLYVEASGRFPATEWRFGDRTWVDDMPHVLPLMADR